MLTILSKVIADLQFTVCADVVQMKSTGDCVGSTWLDTPFQIWMRITPRILLNIPYLKA